MAEPGSAPEPLIAPDVFAVATAPEVLARWPDPAASLTPAETERAAAMRHRQHADAFIAAHLLARECVARWLRDQLPASITISQRCPDCGGPHGPPTVVDHRDVHVSWSHSGDWVAAIAAASRVGIDVEDRSRMRRLDGAVVRRTMTAAEASLITEHVDPVVAFLRAWTVKESLVKAGALRPGQWAGTDLAELLREPATAERVVRTSTPRGVFAIRSIVDDSVVAAIATVPVT